MTYPMHDTEKVFTFCQRKHRVEEYPHIWRTGDTGIPISITDWCTNNCRSDWGWWFDHDSIGIIGFFDRDEMVNALLMHADLID